MKKFLALFMVLALTVCCFAACGTKVDNDATDTDATASDATATDATATDVPATDYEALVCDYAAYAAAALDTKVTVETYVQAKQSWWDNKATVYTQDEDGAYFLYEMACSEEDYALLVPGTKIKVTGYKSEWSGEVEITDATFEIIDGNYVATALDVTDILADESLINKQNMFVAFKGMTIEAYDETGAAFAYKNADEKTDDLYFKASVNGATYDFCVEYYLCNEETEVYKAVENLKVGDVVDMEGFLYWYEGANAHITSLTVAA